MGVIKGRVNLAILHSLHAVRGNSFFTPSNWGSQGLTAKNRKQHFAVLCDQLG